MDPNEKKTALRAIPYGLYVLSTEDGEGRVAASTVNWLTQISFEPPLVVVGVKRDSATHDILHAAGSFALNVLGKGQQPVAFAFFKPVQREGDRIGGERFRAGKTGVPILESGIAAIECRVVETVERGDHSAVFGEVVAVSLRAPIEGRPDASTLTLADLGEKTFYGG